MQGNYDNYDFYQNSQDYYDTYVNEQLGSAKKTFSRVGLALVAYLLASNVAVIIGQIIMIVLFGTDAANELFYTNIYVTYAFNIVSQYIIAFPILYLVIRKLRPMRAQTSQMSGKEFLIAFLISQAFMQLGSIIGEAINLSIGSVLGGEITNDVSDMIMETPIWLIVLAVIIIGPIFEELIFRKIIFDRISRFGTKTAIIVTAVAFGLFHGNLYQLFYATALGLVLGFIYAKTRNVLYPILMHMIINCLGTLPVLLLSESFEAVQEFLTKYMSGESFDIAVYYGDILIYGAYSFIINAMVISGIIMFAVYLKNKKLNVPDICDFKIPKGYASSVTLANAGAIIFLVLAGLTIITNLVPAVY